MLSLLLGAICFAGIHLGVAGTTLRDRAIAALGEGAYRAVFSIVSLVAIVWLVMAYKDAPYVATWGIPEWWKPIAIILYASRLSPGGVWIDHAEPDLRGPGRAGDV